MKNKFVKNKGSNMKDLDKILNAFSLWLKENKNTGRFFFFVVRPDREAEAKGDAWGVETLNTGAYGERKEIVEILNLSLKDIKQKKDKFINW